MDVDVGRVVAGKYELVRLLGRGSMGEVWVGHHKSLGEHVAVKLLSQNPSPQEELEDPATAAARFRFEAQVAAKLSRRTRHIVRVTDHGEEDGLAYLVMELLEGETLDAVLARDGRVPLATVVKIVTQVARALAHAHAEGVFHRDLKPANLFLTRDEEGKLLVKLLDFGIARVTHAHRVQSAFTTAKGLIFGTPSYMSPEQARGSPRLDFRCDLWALATLAYEALSGELPIDGTDTDDMMQNLCAGRTVPLRRRDPQLPAVLEPFFARAFSDAIGARFQSASDLAKAFAAAAAPALALDRQGPTDPPPPLVDRPATPVTVDKPGGPPAEALAADGLPRRGRLVAIVAAVGVMLALLAAGVTWRAVVQPPPAAADVPGAASTPATPAPARAPAATATVAAGSLPSPVVTAAVPAVPISALPPAAKRPPGTGRAPSVPAAASVPPAHTAAPAAAPSAKTRDKSEVF
jgi:serine/threonine-protein kinase